MESLRELLESMRKEMEEYKRRVASGNVQFMAHHDIVAAYYLLIFDIVEKSKPIHPDDERVRRLAVALAEGCDGRSFASDDAKELYNSYTRYKSDPSLTFDDCRTKAYCDFIVKVLGSEGPAVEVTFEEVK